MQIRDLTTDEWHGRMDSSKTIDNPTWDQVRQAIALLDGTVRTMAILAKSDDDYLIIGGQWNGLYLANASFNNRKFFSLVDPNRSTKKVLLFVGGQDGYFQENKWVAQAWALEAAEHYYVTGELKETMHWVSD